MKEIFTQAGSIAHKAGSPISGGAFTITSQPSLKVKAGQGVYKTTLMYTFAGGNASGFIPGSIATTAPASINSTAQKVKADGALVMLKGDFGVMTCTGTLTSGVPGTIAGPVEINNAGQTKAQAC